MNNIPKISAEQMKKVDQLMVGFYHITLRQMMENAGRNLSELSFELYPKIRHAVCFVGAGGNGGGVLVAARHLAVKNVNIRVVLMTDQSKMIDESAEELKSLEAMGITVIERGEFSPKTLALCDLIIDGMIGYNIKGRLRPNVARICAHLSHANIPILSNDLPSGVHPDKGYIHQDCIHATHTLTIGLPKKGICDKSLKAVVGNLYLGNISIPADLYNQIGIVVPPDLFHDKNVFKLN